MIWQANSWRNRSKWLRSQLNRMNSSKNLMRISHLIKIWVEHWQDLLSSSYVVSLINALTPSSSLASRRWWKNVSAISRLRTCRNTSNLSGPYPLSTTQSWKRLHQMHLPSSTSQRRTLKQVSWRRDRTHRWCNNYRKVRKKLDLQLTSQEKL